MGNKSNKIDLKGISTRIETSKARLQFSLAKGNDKEAYQALRDSAQAHSELYEQVKAAMPKRKPREPHYLVFSDEHLDGARLSQTELRALTKRMSKSDLATHVAIPIDEGMEEAVEQAIFLDQQDSQNGEDCA